MPPYPACLLRQTERGQLTVDVLNEQYSVIGDDRAAANGTADLDTAFDVAGRGIKPMHITFGIGNDDVSALDYGRGDAATQECGLLP